MSARELLRDLTARGVELWVSGERLQYRAPRGVLSAEWLARLSEHKQALLELLRERGEAPDAGAGDAPLSWAQQRLWLLDQLLPGNPLYNITVGVQLSGALDVGALERSLAETLRRHSVLRATFRVADGRPVQSVTGACECRLEVVDLRGEPPAARQPLARRLAREQARRPFDLARGPLWRAALLRMSDEEHWLVLGVHHIVADGWSLSVVLPRELAAHYEALVRGESCRLPELALQYADFARRERARWHDAALEEPAAFWRRRLAGLPALQWPGERVSRGAARGAGSRAPLTIARPLADAIEGLAQRAGATPFMVLLSGLLVLVGRYTGQDDVAVGCSLARRDRAELADLVGHLVSTPVVRADLSGDPPWLELLGRVRAAALEAYAQAEFPLEKLVDEADRARGRSAPFQVAFDLQNAPGMARFGGLLATPFDIDPGTVRFDLELHLWKDDHGLRGFFEFDEQLFETALAARMAAHFVRLLETVVARPTCRLSEIGLLDEAERHQVLVAWSGADSPYPRDARLEELFTARVRQAPQAEALVSPRETLSYVELESRVLRVAHALRGLGVAPGVPVAICLERSLEQVVATLGTLAAGGFYVPLDPDHPPERLEFILAETQAAVLITQVELLGAWDVGGAQVLCLLEGGHPLAGGHPTAPAGSPVDGPARPGALDLAYVTYTSGSTGRPKGVAVPHRAVNRLVLGSDYVQLGPGDRVAHLASPAFDAATFEIWGALLTGATLVVIPPETVLAPRAFAACLRDERVSALFVTTSLFNQVAREVPHAFAGVRALLVGGEAADPGTMRGVLEAGPPGRLLNAYGPTENTTFSTWARLERVAGDAASVPIGRPIANSRAYVLDAHLRPLPPGVVGELHLGGDGLARGYFGRADLTAERFVPHPFPDRPGERLYRTGDLVRHLEGGALEFVGRNDDQVKIRGFRIEPAEISAVLAQCPGVSAAYVTVRVDPPGERRLVAYLAADPASPPPWRAFLQERLPDYMVPAAGVVLEALPLNRNGKVDRAALPAPDAAGASARVFVAPQDEAEERLARLWAELLGVARVGRDDDFFELGGHSLMATQLLSRVREEFGLELAIGRLFEAPRLRDMAGDIREAGFAPDDEAGPLVPQPREGELPLSFAQERLWFLDQLEPGRSVYNIPMALAMKGPLDADALAAALATIVQRHEALRTVFVTHQGRAAQRVDGGARFELARLDLRGRERPRDVAERRAADEAQRPFDLARGPLVRGTLLRLAEDEHVLLLTAHHIVFDGWSMGVLVRELGALYEAFAQGAPDPLPALPLQYADFARWQRRALRGAVLERQLTWWKQRLRGGLPVLALPTERPRPAVQSYRGGHHWLRLPAGLTTALVELSQREGATLFMTLLAAFAALLQRYTQQSDIVIGSPVANRNRREIEGLIGFFVNTLVLRLDLSGAPSFRALLAQARETALGAYAHQDLPFEKLVEELQPERDRSRSPLFQVLLALHNAPMPPLRLGELVLTPLEHEGRTSKFDLSVYWSDTRPELRGHIEYNRDLFDPAGIARLAAHYERLLEGVVADPLRPVSRLALVDPRERAQVLVEWNATAAEYPRLACVHELLAEQARRTPEAPAVEYEERGLSFARLEHAACRLARRLTARGAAPGVLVGVCLERSVELVVALLGILKTGAAYVPLDPGYPPERLAFMLTDAQAALLVTQRSLAGTLPELPHTRRIVLDDELDATREEAAPGGTAPAVTSQDLAYVIYTSGSTGQPKGVGVTHRALVNFLTSMARSPGLGPEDTLLAVTPLSFDIAGLELFLPLLTGARLVLVSSAVAADGVRLAEQLRARSATVMQATPATWGLLLAAGWEGEPDLRALCGGEALPRDLAQALVPRCAELWNLYGPTETTIWSAHGRVTPGEGPITIGRPLANTSLYVLDENLEPTPLGAAGELYIGGDGLARGYHRRPELTGEKFVPNPFGPAGARLYRTGDRARLLPGGEIEVLGRLDQQIKLRGFRIEPGEVEAALRRHAAVREAAVVVRGDGGAERLVAYFVPGGELVPGTTELRELLKKLLPAYMLPAAFVPLPALPLTPNRKLDRRALPAPSAARPDLGHALVPPRTPTEALLAQVYAETLGLEHVGIHDSFFDLGGASIQSVEVSARVSEAGLALAPEQIFEHPTVAELAAVLAPGEGPADAPVSPEP